MKHIQHEIPSNFIVKLFRIGREQKGPIVIEMSSLDKKRDLLKKKGKKSLFSDEIGINNNHSQVQLNHYLCTPIQEMLKAAKILKEYGYKFIWPSYTGQVLVKRNESSPCHAVYSQDDIKRLISISKISEPESIEKQQTNKLDLNVTIPRHRHNIEHTINTKTPTISSLKHPENTKNTGNIEQTKHIEDTSHTKHTDKMEQIMEVSSEESSGDFPDLTAKNSPRKKKTNNKQHKTGAIKKTSDSRKFDLGENPFYTTRSIVSKTKPA